MSDQQDRRVFLYLHSFLKFSVWGSKPVVAHQVKRERDRTGSPPMVGLRSLGVATFGSILALDKLGSVPPETSRRFVFLPPGSWLAGFTSSNGEAPLMVARSM
jgi:hypothetical protein